MEIILIVILTGVAALWIILHPIKTVKWLLILILVTAVGVLVWGGGFALLGSLLQ